PLQSDDCHGLPRPARRVVFVDRRDDAGGLSLPAGRISSDAPLSRHGATARKLFRVIFGRSEVHAVGVRQWSAAWAALVLLLSVALAAPVGVLPAAHAKGKTRIVVGMP